MSDVVIEGSWMKVRGYRETLCTTFVTSKSKVIPKQKVKKSSDLRKMTVGKRNCTFYDANIYFLLDFTIAKM